MAGYSATPLPQKLGIKAGARLGLGSAPAAFAATLGALPAGVSCADAARARGRQRFDVLVAFFSEREKLESALAALMQKLETNGGLWIAWPKKSSGVATDITEDTIRAVALPRGLVDNKVCAIDEVWSGLRLVYRVSERGGRGLLTKSTMARTPRSSAKRNSQPGR